MAQIAGKVLILLCLFIGNRMGYSFPTIDDEVRQLIYDHAPVIWVHSDEVYYPSSIEFHFANTEVRDGNETVLQENPTRSTIISGLDSSGTHLNSVPDLECGDCVLDWFVGEELVDVPIYTYIRQYDDACGTLDIAYRASFPYNYGKDVCIGVEVAGKCRPADAIQSFGNHVGDWEHLALRFLNGQLSSAYISAHSFGAGYGWNETANNFYFIYGEDFIDNLVPGDYPEYIDMFEDRHPAIYCANGSHGMWAQEGSHQYMTLPISLIDECDQGEAWATWNNMEIIPYEEGYVYDGDYTYVEYQGRWGNLEMGCGIAESVSGECILGSGPTHNRAFPSGARFPTECEE